MPRLNVVEAETAEDEQKEVLNLIEKKYGKVADIFKAMANSPAATRAYLALSEPLSDTALSRSEREVVALVVSQFYGCDYCLAAHTLMGRAAGLPEEEMIAIRRGTADDERRRALVEFTGAVLEKHGNVSDEELEAFRAAGYGDAEAVEVCAMIARLAFTVLVNHVHRTPIEFPRAPEL